MNKFKFYSSVIFPIILGCIGFYLGSYLALPPITTKEESGIIYGLLGVLIGLLTFGRLTSWIVKTATHLLAQLTSKIASEVINQFTQIRSTSRQIPLLSSLSSLPSQMIRSDNISQVSELTETKPKKGAGLLILDTSSIIDGRVIDVAKTGFLEGIVLIPQFVLTELQQVADSSDNIKRARGRKGFDIIDQLKKISSLKVVIWQKEVTGKTVDDKLIRLGKISKGRILTCDYNLNKVATLSGVSVLNLNELANSLKTRALPGETIEIKVIQKGKDDHQGVGYLEDGTMVVVEGGSKLVGERISVETTKMIQNPAGRIIFGRKIDLKSYPQP